MKKEEKKGEGVREKRRRFGQRKKVLKEGNEKLWKK